MKYFPKLANVSAVAEIGGNPASKHQVQLECGE